MGRSPFVTKELSSQARAKQRRSTRIDFITPIILSGKDATGQIFREETQTSIVNLHGSKVLTKYQVLVGMIVTVEVVRTGRAGKTVCVQVYDPAPGETIHHIAVQLVQPGNIWGVENPPPDWEAVEAELGGARQPVPTASAKASVTGMKPLVLEPSTIPSPVGRGPADGQFTELEKRTARLMDSVLEILRLQADSAVRNAVQEIEKRMESIGAAAELRFRESAEQAGAGLETTLETIRTEAIGDVVRETLQGLEPQLEAASRQMETRFARRCEQILEDFEARLRSVHQKQAAHVEEGETRINRAAEQAIAKIESSRQSLRESEEKISAESQAGLTRRKEEALAELETSLRAIQERQRTQAEEAEMRISKLSDQAMADFEIALQTFRADVGDELAARREEAVGSAEQALRERLAALLSTLITVPGAQPGAPATVAPPKPAK
ncbi:MAG: hypothetical protein ACE145_03885 [Terriglobia bacterium]